MFLLAHFVKVAKNDKNQLFASIESIQVGPVRAYEIPENVRKELAKTFEVHVPHFIIQTKANHLEEFERTLQHLCHQEFKVLKNEIKSEME